MLLLYIQIITQKLQGNKPPLVMALQLIHIFSLISLLLPPAFSTALIAKPSCLDRCGDLQIPYPFGVGSDCSMDPYFNINCNTSTDPPKPYLSIINKEVVEINRTYIRVRYPTLISACYDLSDDRRINESYKHSLIVNLSGTPYALSSVNRLTAIGCDDVAMQSNGTSVISGGDGGNDGGRDGGGCSAFCADAGGGVGYCPSNGSLLGNGCCQTEIAWGTTLLGAQLMDMSSKLLRRKLFPCSYAFIQERINSNHTVYSYPLYYLHNSTALLKDNWASTTKPPVVRLRWVVGAENCRRAKLNSSSYACRDEKSVCMDDDDGRGYLCMCVQGYEGNPYLHGGCQTISFSSSYIAKHGCQDQCGRLSIPFPFGIGPNCSLAPSFEIFCDTATNPSKAYLVVLNAEIVELNSSKVFLNYPNIGWTCYNMSAGISKPEKRSLIIDLSRSQYTLSKENWITTIGCDDMVVAVVGENNRSSERTSCAAVCSDRRIISNSFASCPYATTTYVPGDGCCRAPIPRGTTFLEANLMELSGRWPRANFSCSYASVEYNENENSYSVSYSFLNNSTGITPYSVLPTFGSPPVMALDWRIGAVNCEEARQDLPNFACRDNTQCVDFGGTVRGYLCSCSKGYQGNPYLSPGCRDIDECADNTTNPCDSTSNCMNTRGSFHCSCPKGYFGNGRKDGTGCIQLPESKTKMISLIGMGSGFGLLLVLLLFFWLYKALQKRKLKMVKDKFFKRNGGLLLEQQTNEGVLGKTKVFSSQELEVATDHFNESRILGQGGQGTVYKGMLPDGKIVAVKRSKAVEENQLEQFINEVVILSQINHRNVVKLLGCCLETEVPLLVYEFMPNGTLFDLIHDPTNEFPFSWIMRLKIAADVAGALAYLHCASSMPIYHRDIKSSNILLDEKYVVKVSDFGTSRSVAVDETHLTTLVKGTFGYLDPEYFQSSQFTEKSDVYSFGVVLVELLTRQRAVSLERTDADRSLATRFLTCMEENCVDTILDPQIWEEGRKEEVILVARLAQRCLNLKGKMRPTMKEVANELESYKISQMSTCVIDEAEDVRDFKEVPLTISDIEYTWTGSYKSAHASPSDTHPLIFTTE